MLEPVTLAPHRKDLDVVTSLLAAKPVAALVLGSGLGAIAEGLDDRREVSYDRIAGMQGPTHVSGHADRLVAGTCRGVPVLAFQGRLHTYQGVSALEAAYPALLAAAAGASVFVVTNAAGAVVADLSAGDLMLITDHINLLGDNPLRGWPGPAEGVPFVPMGDAYDPALADTVRGCAAELGVALKQGVYVAVPGPSYETPAEVRALARLGADAVGMSTVPEVIAARALGMRVVGLSLITNAAGGSELSHEEVLESGRRAQGQLEQLLYTTIAALRVL